jgi:hypothetical protein
VEIDFDLQGFGLAATGGYQAWRDKLRLAVLTTNRDVIEDTIDYGKGVMRADLRAAGLSGLDKTWQGEMFPRRGLAWEPSGFLFSKAEVIVQAFDEGATIQPKEAGLLAIPIPGGFAEDFPNPRGPRTKVDYAREKFGDRLFVIPATAGRPAILAVKLVGQTSTGKLRARNLTKTGKFGKGTFTAMLFYLVPEARLEKRLDIQSRFDQIERKFFSTYTQRLAREINAAGID